MIFNELTEDNFLLFAIKNYQNPQGVTKDDFDRDLNHFKYIKRLLNRYEESGELKDRLIVNHLVVLYNVFGNEATRLLFFKLDGYHHMLKPFIILLGRLPEKIPNIGIDNKTILTADIVADEVIAQKLRKI